MSIAIESQAKTELLSQACMDSQQSPLFSEPSDHNDRREGQPDHDEGQEGQPGRDEGQSDCDEGLEGQTGCDEGLEGQTGCDEGQERQSDRDEGQEGQPGRDEGQSDQANDSREILLHDVQLIIIHHLLRVSPVSHYTLQLVNFFF